MELSPEKRAELINYIADARAAKKKEKEIKKNLLDAGWQENLITPVLQQTLPKPKVSLAMWMIIILAVISFSATAFLIWLALK